MRIFRRRDVNDIPYDDVKAWFKVALRLQRDNPNLFNTTLSEMGSEGLEAQRTNFQGWSEEDIEVAAVASFLREARQEGVFKHEE